MKTRHSVQTIMVQCCVVFCTNDWGYKDEYGERTGMNCIFISFSLTRNKGRSGSIVIDGKFAKLLCPPNQHCLPPWLCTNIRRDTIADSACFWVTAKDAGAAWRPVVLQYHYSSSSSNNGCSYSNSSSRPNCSCSGITKTPTTITTTTTNNSQQLQLLLLLLLLLVAVVIVL